MKKGISGFLGKDRNLFYLVLVLLTCGVTLLQWQVGLPAFIVAVSVLVHHKLTPSETPYRDEQYMGKKEDDGKNRHNRIDLPFIPFPYMVLEGKNILFASGKLRYLQGQYVTDVLPGFDFSLGEQSLCIGEEYYTVYQKSIFDWEQDKNIQYLYFVLTQNENPDHDRVWEQVLVSLVFIDNYEEVMDTVEEVRRPLMSAIIDRKLNTLAQQLGGIIQKFEKDRYLFLFTLDKLESLKKRKFDILDQVRQLDMGNTIPVTLSIGMGMDGKTLTQSMEYARAAIDLALGRGGDQVIIKDRETFSYFGGTAKEVGSNGRVRARVKAYALTELIQSASDVIIMGHRNADLDCLGAGIGVYKMVSSLGKPCRIILNNITTNINLLYDQLKEIKEYEHVFMNNQVALMTVSDGTLLVVVDTHRPSLLECPELLSKVNRTVVFDHHRKSAEFISNPVLVYHEPYASSTCELVTEMLQYMGEGAKLLPLEADALLAGITVDTKNFAFKTGAKTFEAAAFLRRAGADSIRVHILFQNDREAYKAKAYAVTNAEILPGEMAIAICPPNVENPTLIAAQVADELLKISGVKTSFVLCEDGEMAVISARSLGDVNVQVIMEKFGGGGHQTVAGAQIADRSLDEITMDLKDVIMEYMHTGQDA